MTSETDYNPNPPETLHQTNRHQTVYTFDFFSTPEATKVEIDQKELTRDEYEVTIGTATVNSIRLVHKPEQSRQLRITRNLKVTRDFIFSEYLDPFILTADQNYQNYLIQDLTREANTKILPGDPNFLLYVRKDGTSRTAVGYEPHFDGQMATKGYRDREYAGVPEGPPGPQGPEGPPGHPGPQGEEGPRGPTGPEGPRGEDIPGPEGPEGEEGPSGVGFHIKGSKPEDEIFLEPKILGDLWITTDLGIHPIHTGLTPIDGEWVDIGRIKGYIGPPGPEGPEGEQGPDGPEGPEGPEGDKGPIGEEGDPGLEGPEGQEGEKGIPGPQGPPGDDATGIVDFPKGIILMWNQSNPPEGWGWAPLEICMLLGATDTGTGGSFHKEAIAHTHTATSTTTTSATFSGEPLPLHAHTYFGFSTVNPGLSRETSANTHGSSMILREYWGHAGYVSGSVTATSTTTTDVNPTGSTGEWKNIPPATRTGWIIKL